MDMTLIIEFVAIAAILGILTIAMRAKDEESSEVPPADSSTQSTS